jgi:hypothetical protein
MIDNKKIEAKFDYKTIKEMFYNIPMNDGKKIEDSTCKEIFEELRTDIENIMIQAVDEIEEVIMNHLMDNSDEDSE